MSPKPLVAATHEEVYRAVVEQKLLSAADLFEFAKQEAAAGNKALYLYCVGTSGQAKRNLETIVQALWTGHEKMKERALMAEATAAPLSKEELEALKKLARTKPQETFEEASAKADASIKVPRPPSERSIFCSPKMLGLQRVVPSKARAPAAPREVHVFPCGGPSATVTFRPKALRWRLREYYQLLVELRSEASLRGVFPGLRSTILVPRSDDKQPAEFRVTLGDILWQPNSDPTTQSEASQRPIQEEDRWIDDIPASENFDVDTFELIPAEGRLVTVATWAGVEDHQVLALCRAVERCGHDIEKTTGFKYKNGTLHLDRHSEHTRPALHRASVPWGILAAPLVAHEAALVLKDVESPGSGTKRRASQALPQPYSLTKTRVSRIRPAIACREDALTFPIAGSVPPSPALAITTGADRANAGDGAGSHCESAANDDEHDEHDDDKNEENDEIDKHEPLATCDSSASTTVPTSPSQTKTKAKAGAGAKATRTSTTSTSAANSTTPTATIATTATTTATSSTCVKLAKDEAKPAGAGVAITTMLPATSASIATAATTAATAITSTATTTPSKKSKATGKKNSQKMVGKRTPWPKSRDS